MYEFNIAWDSYNAELDYTININDTLLIRTMC